MPCSQCVLSCLVRAADPNPLVGICKCCRSLLMCRCPSKIFKLRKGLTGTTRYQTLEYGSKHVETNQSQQSHLEIPSSEFDLQNSMNSQVAVDKGLLRSTCKQIGPNGQLQIRFFLQYAQAGTRI